MRAGSLMTSTAVASATEPLASAPVRSGIWPARMLTAIPVRKPVITECDTKRV